MTVHKRPDEGQAPQSQNDRDVANDESHKPPHNREPQPDHSEREWGGDQDIDTAGQVPGEMATDDDDATGF